MQQLGLDKLSLDDRIALIEELEESIERDMEQELPTEAQWAEIQRRIAASDADPSRLIPWEVVRADLLL